MKTWLIVKNALILLILGWCLTAQGQTYEEDRISFLKTRLENTFDEDEAWNIRSEIDQLEQTILQKEQSRQANTEQNEMNFERKLNYVRGVMVERDEQAVVGVAHVKLDKALYGFLQTDFMKEYKSLKIEAESLAATFKAQAARMDPAEVSQVKRAYTHIAEDFNRFIVEVKRDFLDRKKLKLIRTNKEMYANSLQYKLRELKDVYSQDFERVVADVTGSDMYAAVPLATIFGLIKLAKDFTEFIVRSNYEARRVKEEHLNQYLVEPYRFRSWFEIEMLEGDIYNNFGGETENFNEFDPGDTQPEVDSFEDLDPFEYDVDAPSLSRKRKIN